MTKYKFDEIAINSTQKKKPTEEDKVYYIGLEHIDPGCFDVVRWGSDVAPTGDKLLMQKGDVLFGKRRAYQRKVAIAPFDGIFSAHGMVLRPNLKVIDANYFPFFISSDKFMETAVRISVGGLSPTINWKDLARQEFELPSLDEQKVLADKLWAAYRLKEAYKKLLVATDEMVKSQFIEMFGNVESKPLIEVCIKRGEYGSNVPADDYDGSIRYVRITDITEEGNLNNVIVSPRKIEEKYMLLPGDLLFARTGNTVGKTYLHKSGKMIFAGYLIRYRLNKELMLPQFVFAYTHTNQYYDWVDKTKKVGAQPNISAAQYDSMPIPVPQKDAQMKFVAIAEQADKSKFGDFKSQFIEMFGNPLSLNQKNELKRLGECCILNPRRPNIALCDTDKVSFIPMSAISEEGYLADMTDEEYGKVKKGFTYFENNDVLFAKITPCMENGKGAIVHGLTNRIGMGSTEFHVLRPINGISSPYWLLALTRMPIFRERAAKNMSGTGGQKRVSASYLDHFMVGLPAIEEQRRFEAIYKQADKSKSVIQKALVYLNDIQSDELGKIA